MAPGQPWDPVGIETTETFRAYVNRLRATARDPEPAQHHGPSTETRRSVHSPTRMSTTTATASDSDDQFATTPTPDYGAALTRVDGAAIIWLDAAELAPPAATTGEMGRRAFLVATAVTAATTAGIGTAAANTDHGLDYDSELVPNPTVPATATIAESRPEMGVLEYIDDSGDDAVTSLASYGASIEAREAADEVHNPVRSRADFIHADVYGHFPNGETYEDEDGDDQPLSAVDAQHWAAPASELEVTETDTDAGGMALDIDATGVGGEVVATFTDVERDSGVDRTYFQVGYSVHELDDTTTIEFRVRSDAGNSRTLVIDPDGTDDDVDVLGTGDETAAIRQVELGELTGELDAIDELEIAVLDGDAHLEVFALAAERSDRWSFGTREIVDPDDSDELTTETIYEPTAWFEVTDYASIPSMFREEQMVDLQADIEFETRNLPASAIDTVFEPADRYSEDQRFHMVTNIELPAAYDLDLDVGDAVDTQRHQSSAHLVAELLVGDHSALTMGDLDDYEDDFIDRTTAYDAGIDEELELSAMAGQGDTLTVHYDILVSDGHADAMQASAGGGLFGGGGREGGGGIVDMILSPIGMLSTAVIGYGTFALARARGVIGGVRG